MSGKNEMTPYEQGLREKKARLEAEIEALSQRKAQAPALSNR